MNHMSTLQALELIDLAANENRLYHHNGGQAYIRLSMDSDVLMVIDHTVHHKPEVNMYDGAKYFRDYPNYNSEHSKRLREHGSLAKWYAECYLAEAI